MVVTPKMLAAGWAILNQVKNAVRLRSLGVGPGLTEVYTAMREAEDASSAKSLSGESITALVESAYKEGLTCGHNCGVANEHPDDKAWDTSIARHILLSALDHSKP